VKMPDMGKMLGPLPVGAWVAVVGGGLGFMLYTRSHAPATGTDTGGGSPLDTVGNGAVGGWQGTGPATADPGGTNVGTITDNQSWASAVENWLIAHSYDPAQVVSAISNGLYGAALSPTQWAIWETALLHQGAPPENFTPPTQSSPTPIPVKPKPPPPKPKPPPPKPKPKPHPSHTYYVVRPGDSLSKIAAKFHTTWQVIYNNNRKIIHNPNMIFPGQRLFIK
jgi:LysM repeat protein